MTPNNIEIVQQSFRRVLSDPEGGGVLLSRMMRAPGMVGLFPADAPDARRRLIAVFAFTIEALDDFEMMAPALRVAGARYRDLGAGPAEYAQFRNALMETLEWALGPDWTPGLRAAWAEAYAAIAGTMQETVQDRRSAA